MKEKKGLQGKRILITAGPTREPLDAVRFLSNPATGRRMGFALAAAARERGAGVTLVSGPTLFSPPSGVDCIQVGTTREMHRAVRAEWERTDVFIAAAAPADYRPQKISPGKIKKKEKQSFSLSFERNPDILKEMAREKGRRILIGFAGETEALLENASGKLQEKNLDLIVANDLTREGSGFAAATNEVTLIDREGKKEALPRLPKEKVAERILSWVEEKLKQRDFKSSKGASHLV